MESPLVSVAWFTIGPVPITHAVVVTWGMMIVLAGLGFLLTRQLRMTPGRLQSALELIVDTVDGQIRNTMRTEPAPYRAFIGTLFLYILFANWAGLLPGIEPPTARIETDAALALVVFCSVIWFGVKSSGVWGYLKSFAAPNPLMLPLNFVESLTRSFSLLVRLFGNVMSGVFVVGIVLSLAGLFVPIPFMALEMLTGAIQAYIFAILALVFIAGAVGNGEPESSDTESRSSS